MGFSLKGIFTNNTDVLLLRAARKQWPLARIKVFQNEQYKGLVIAEAELINLDNYAEIMTHNDSLYEQIVLFSEQFPDISFAYIWADSHGGTCFYDGFVCTAGQIILDKRGEATDESEKYSYGAELDKLRSLLKAVNIHLSADGHFLPFTRTFFDEPRPILPENPRQPTKSWWQFWK